MFPGAEEMWALMGKVREAGYLPYLLLVPDQNGPLSALRMPPVHTTLEHAHMDQLKTIMARLVTILQFETGEFCDFAGYIWGGWTS